MVETETKIQRYDSYKDSDVEWLGDIPEHWQVKPGFTILFESKEKNTGFKENTVLSLSYGNVIIKPEEKLTGLVPESFETYQLVEPGDIIIRPTDLQNDKTSLRTGLAKDKGIITSAYINLRILKGYSNKYFHYYLHTIDINKVIYGLGSGLRQNISFEDFKRFPFPFPPLPEQTAIAQFLDDKTTKIDQAIAIKQQQIALLKERKQILIHKAVTRGLNKKVALKDSGVEWIGEIPEHWEVKKFKHFTKILAGYSPEQVNITEYGTINYYKVDNLNDVDSNNKLGKSLWLIEAKNNINLCKENILLIPKRGGAISTNKIAITQTKSIFDTNVMGLDFDDKKVSIELISFWIKHRNLITIADTTTIPQINNKHIYPLEIALPDLEEQKEIAQYIETASAKIETAISFKEQEINKLQEYKSSLINSVVTGKVRVC